MSAAQAAPNPPAQPDDAQYHREILRELIGMGIELARGVHQQATAHPAPRPAPAAKPAFTGGPAPTPDPTVAFARIARCVRRSIALAQKLAEQLAEPAPQPAQGRASLRTAARKRIIRKVEDVIHRKADGPRAESLHAELADRLDAPDLEDDLAARPVAEIITEICRDLGLDDMPGSRPCKRRTPADIEALRARAATPPGLNSPRPAPPAPPAPPQPTLQRAPLPALLPTNPAEAVAHVLRHGPLFRRE